MPVFSRRLSALALSAGLALFLVSGCGTQDSLLSDYSSVLRQSFTNMFRKSSVTRDQAADIPYASLGYRLNGGNEAILVLATDRNDDQIWTSSSHVVLTMRGGRVSRTVGLPGDRAALISKNGDALPPLANALRGTYRSSRVMDVPSQGIYGLVLNCVTSPRGPEPISIIGTQIATVRVDEICASTEPRWSFTDNYWLDAKTGFVWHSVQHLDPSGNILQFEVLRPPE